MDSEPVRDYLADLEAAAADIAPERRTELVDDVREHIALALAERGRTDEATVSDVLDRLGPPSEIVAAEGGDASIAFGRDARPAVSFERERRRLSVETRALLLLTVGAIALPFIGPVLGLWVASGSKRWSLTQKRTAALIVFVLLALPFAILVPALASGEITWVFSTGGFLLPFVPLAGALAAAYLVASSSLIVSVSRRPQPTTDP